MLKTIVYINLMLAVVYFLTWLQQGSYYAITGIILIILFCIYVLWSIEKEQYTWGILNFVMGILVLTASGFLMFSGANLLLSGLESGYQSPSLVFLYTYSFVFGLTLLLQLLLIVLKIGRR